MLPTELELAIPVPICHRPWTGFEVFDHLGDVRPCCWGKVSCGNINRSSVDEIWTGETFEFYRAQMLQGNYAAICKPECPILQGVYTEAAGEPEPLAKLGLESSPRYFRVVPTTQCNLKCPMCYQRDDPPPTLPTDFEQMLDHWLPAGVEFLVLGGEPFLAKNCLRWFEKLSPEKYPALRLAAITNGLCFSSRVIELILARRWSWILVSVDAASSSVYKKVRGGSYRQLLDNLNYLAQARNSHPEPFELRFGFTLQNANLQDALPFLDLCDQYQAIPQFTEVFGDWHDQTAQTEADVATHLATLEVLDRELCARGFSACIIKVALSRLLGGRRQSRVSRVSPAALALASRAMQMITLATPTRECVEAVLAQHANRDGRFTIHIPASGPDGQPLSVLAFREVVEELIARMTTQGWSFCGGATEESNPGSDDEGGGPEVSEVHHWSAAQSAGTCVGSIIVPIYNQAQALSSFLKSIAAQDGLEDWHLVLIDDGSTDQSFDMLMEWTSRLALRCSGTLVRRSRSQPYVPNTFSFTAGAARQEGLSHARGETIVFLDPDQVVDVGCLRAHRNLQDAGIDCVIGERRHPAPRPWHMERHWQELRSRPLSNDPGWWLSFYTGNASVRRSVLDAVGGFDCSLRYWGLDDTDLGYRLARHGVRAWYSLRPQVVHQAGFPSGGGATLEELRNSHLVHMEVLYRKYLALDILDSYRFAWKSAHDR